MQILRLYDCRISRLPALIGLCQSDIPQIAQFVNAAQRRLLMAKEAGDEGWWGTWAEMAFTVSQTQPYLTVPRQVARLQSVNVCERPVGIQNQFYEYLDFGNGRLPKTIRRCDLKFQQVYTRNSVPTFVDLSNPPQRLRIVAVDPADAGKRVLLQGTDQNGKTIYSQDTYNPTTGVFVTLSATFEDAPMTFNSLTGIQKDVTVGNVEIHQIDPTTGADVLLLTMEPSEQTASYRRYYFDSLPRTCCPPAIIPSQGVANLTVTAIVKLDLIPVMVDTDYLLIQNLEAITEECQSVRLSGMDSIDAKQQARERHKAAIEMLNGELAHYLGIDKPAISFKPFGSADLSRIAVGRLF